MGDFGCENGRLKLHAIAASALQRILQGDCGSEWRAGSVPGSNTSGSTRTTNKPDGGLSPCRRPQHSSCRNEPEANLNLRMDLARGRHRRMRSGRGRQFHSHRRALPGLAGRGDRSAVGLHQRARNGQPEAESSGIAGARGIGAMGTGQRPGPVRPPEFPGRSRLTVTRARPAPSWLT